MRHDTFLYTYVVGIIAVLITFGYLWHMDKSVQHPRPVEAPSRVWSGCPAG